MRRRVASAASARRRCSYLRVDTGHTLAISLDIVSGRRHDDPHDTSSDELSCHEREHHHHPCPDRRRRPRRPDGGGHARPPRRRRPPRRTPAPSCRACPGPPASACARWSCCARGASRTPSGPAASMSTGPCGPAPPWQTAAGGPTFELGFPTREQSALISPTAPACVPQDHWSRCSSTTCGAPPAPRRAGDRGRRDRASTPTASASRCATSATGATRRVEARYVVAADGAHSRVRAALGIEMRGPDESHRGVHGAVPGAPVGRRRRRTAT